MAQQDHVLELLDSIYRSLINIDTLSMELALNNIRGDIVRDSDQSVSFDDLDKIDLFIEVLGELNEILPQIQYYGL